MGTENILRQKCINYAYPSNSTAQKHAQCRLSVSLPHEHLFGWELDLATTAHHRGNIYCLLLAQTQVTI